LVKDILEKKLKKWIFRKKTVYRRSSKNYSPKIIQINRKGKILFFKLKNNLYINFHLKLTGQLLFAHKQNSFFKKKIPFSKTKKLPGNTTRIILTFSDDSVLYFNDLRKFGWLKVSDKPIIPKGIDVLSKKFTLNKLVQLISTSFRPIKLFLMDQEKIAGIGNIYANDALFLAKIHPMKKSNLLTNTQIKNLYKQILYVIKEGIKTKRFFNESYILRRCFNWPLSKSF
jgi:formamidopyrimidine-DNA glycosylase